uniref:ATP-dependent DNA helicase n=1 Tax=Lactuca sativa TaxID=4236 RepID=A0A9R1UMB0_LACSA|nr:hypothetical protein LSAT_V11C800408900 [Lactuca sativa]
MMVLIRCLTARNEYIRNFKTSKQIANEIGLQSYFVCFHSNIPNRRYSVPVPGSLRCIIIGDESNCGRYDIVIQSKGGNVVMPNVLVNCIPLVTTFKCPKQNWCLYKKKLTVSMYYNYQIHLCQHICSHKYLVDAYTCMEADRLDYILHHQEQLRSNYVSDLYDALSKGDRDNKVIGKRVYSPATFVGGPCYMYKHYQDALAICRVYGNPHFFITFTCNIKWSEIQHFMDLHLQHDVHSRTDIISCVFQIKVDAFIKFLKEDKTFGDMIRHKYIFCALWFSTCLPLWFHFLPYSCLHNLTHPIHMLSRFIHNRDPKKGLPHCHTLLWTSSADMIKEPADIDKYMTAELPDPVLERPLYDRITSCMLHGPYGLLNKSAPCMKNDKCSKNIRKPFQKSTFFDKNGYTCYKRNSSSRHMMPNGIIVDNGYVGTYNKRLSSRFRAHINVEYCGWNMMVKYLFKYISKGVERIRLTTAWRILNFDIHIIHPPVMILPVYLPYMQNVIFRADMPIHRVLSNLSLGRTPLWDDVVVSPKECISYKDVRTVSGQLYVAFRDACNALGLIGDDIEWMAAFNEASTWVISPQLQSLFCHLLLFCEVNSPFSLWEFAYAKMVDDYVYKLHLEFPGSSFDDLENMLHSSTPSRSLADFKLSTPSNSSVNVLTNYLKLEEIMYDKEDLHRKHLQMLSYFNRQGTGKTFLWTIIISYFRSLGKVVLAVAASGIASLLLPCGRTSHSRFKIPIDLSDKKSCDIKKKMSLAEFLKHTSLIIWDEATMSDRCCFECVDRSLRDILDCDQKPFWRQTLPVKSKSTHEAIMSSTLPHCYLWKSFQVYRLTKNMWLMNAPANPGTQFFTSDFAEWILKVSNETIGV